MAVILKTLGKNPFAVIPPFDCKNKNPASMAQRVLCEMGEDVQRSLVEFYFLDLEGKCLGR